MSPEGGINGPLSYHVLGGTIFGGIGVLLMGLLQVALASMGPMGNKAGAEAIASTLCNVVALPVICVIVAFMGSALYHLIVLVLGGTRGYETTFRVYAYSAGAVQVLAVIPGLGGMVGGIWSMVLVYNGFRHCQQMSSGRALMATLAPVILSCCCFGAIAFAFVSANPRGF
jgi:hypothetical protein